VGAARRGRRSRRERRAPWSTFAAWAPRAAHGYRSGVAGQGTPATTLLRRSRVAHTVHPYAHDPRSESYGVEAATALGVDPARCFKTLIADVDGTMTVAVVPVSGSLDLKALAAAVGGKRASMADPAAAERSSGYVRGGISPLGQRKALRTVIDSSATDAPTMYVSAGRRGLEIELAAEDLATLTGGTFAAISSAG
jgi:Cys-tRNA(Pro)/Cys-tRNA(Cys) deacylase